MTNFEYLKPESVEEVSDLLLKYGKNAKVYNGGTDLLVRLRDNHIKAGVLIDIKAIPHMDNIHHIEGEGLFIGASVTMNQLVDNNEIVNNYYILAESAHTVASHQLRNRATLVGNLCNASPGGDTLPSLYVLDAKVKVFGPSGYKILPVSEFVLGVRKIALNKGEFVTGIILPQYNEKGYGTYYKQSRRKDVDLATVGTAVSYYNKEWKICFAAVAPKPLRAIETEKLLNSIELINENTIMPVLEMAASEVKPITDIRASKEYRTEIVKVSVKRAVLNVCEQIEENK